MEGSFRFFSTAVLSQTCLSCTDTLQQQALLKNTVGRIHLDVITSLSGMVSAERCCACQDHLPRAHSIEGTCAPQNPKTKRLQLITSTEKHFTFFVASTEDETGRGPRLNSSIGSKDNIERLGVLSGLGPHLPVMLEGEVLPELLVPHDANSGRGVCP